MDTHHRRRRLRARMRCPRLQASLGRTPRRFGCGRRRPRPSLLRLDPASFVADGAEVSVGEWVVEDVAGEIRLGRDLEGVRPTLVTDADARLAPFGSLHPHEPYVHAVERAVGELRSCL